jgi:hypothetical protein
MSPAERDALSTLESYGFDFGPAFIGRARRFFVERGEQPTADQIVDYVLVLQKRDEKDFPNIGVTITQAEAREFARLRAIDSEATADLRNLLREMVESERIERAGKERAGVEGLPPKIALFKINAGRYAGKVMLKGRRYSVTADLGTDHQSLVVRFEPKL